MLGAYTTTPSSSTGDEASLQPGDPLACALACCISATLEVHQREARLFDAPKWLCGFASAQQAIGRWTLSDLERTGLPSPERVLEEVCTVSEATATSRVVAILALGLLDRVLNTNSPATRLAHDNWSLVWLFCIHFAAKIHYDVCKKIINPRVRPSMHAH